MALLQTEMNDERTRWDPRPPPDDASSAMGTNHIAARTLPSCNRGTPDVKTFVFTSPTDWMFCFSAGQYVLVHLKIEGAAVTRSYSVSSPPTRPLDLQITVKRT
ncbi:hypothetical protein EN947_34410, partial [Mesorhizobium sp. M7A.F.Ca.US.003.02.2.1]